MEVRGDLQDELVSVVIPAHNCAATIGDTLNSVRAQTHRQLEIIVVDDGSKDGTAQVVAAHAAIDPRVRLLRQDNAGVAAARNNGIAAARGEFIAPIDGDDLWRPSKIERQLEVMATGGESIGLVYCWSCVIDEAGAVISQDDRPHFAGDVIPLLFYGNFVGNGSCALMRRQVVLDAGGYDPSLRARGGQGCEDWKLYLAIAEAHRFGVVLDHLVGYRRLRGAMSDNIVQMLQSDALVRAELLARSPRHRAELERGRWLYLRWLLEREVGSGTWDRCQMLLDILAREDGSPMRAAARRQRYRARFALRRFAGERRRPPPRPVFLPSPSASKTAA